jgi:hypothetical protein
MGNKLVSIFSFFSQKITGQESIVEDRLLENFLKILSLKYDPQTLGDWFAWNYVAFQFAFWYDKKTRLNGKIPPNWVFGTKALERWTQRERNWSYFTNLFLSKLEIVSPVEYFGKDMVGVFEQERKRFLNSEIGFLHCQASSVFSKKSPSCIICKYKKDCQEVDK